MPPKKNFFPSPFYQRGRTQKPMGPLSRAHSAPIQKITLAQNRAQIPFYTPSSRNHQTRFYTIFHTPTYAEIPPPHRVEYTTSRRPSPNTEDKQTQTHLHIHPTEPLHPQPTFTYLVLPPPLLLPRAYAADCGYQYPFHNRPTHY